MKLRVRGLVTIVIAIVTIISLVANTITTNKVTEKIYTKDVQIVYTERDAIYVVDSMGEEWIFLAEDERLTVGSFLRLSMTDNATPKDNYDDRILDYTIE